MGVVVACAAGAAVCCPEGAVAAGAVGAGATRGAELGRDGGPIAYKKIINCT